MSSFRYRGGGCARLMRDGAPAARLLAVLELLQDRPGVNGPAIAERLGVSTRTVRRYIATLEDMGIPVAPSPGRLGGYRLLPGFRLPPLMFSADEAVGLAVALLATRATAYDDLPAAVGSALRQDPASPACRPRPAGGGPPPGDASVRPFLDRRPTLPRPSRVGGPRPVGAHASAVHHPLPPRPGDREPA